MPKSGFSTVSLHVLAEYIVIPKVFFFLFAALNIPAVLAADIEGPIKIDRVEDLFFSLLEDASVTYGHYSRTIEARKSTTTWYFTTANDPAHPAVIKGGYKNPSDLDEYRMIDYRCEGSETECKKMIKEFLSYVQSVNRDIEALK